MGNQYSLPTKAGFTKTPLAGDQKPLLGEPNQNGGQNLSTIVDCTTSNGIFISLDILFWMVFTCLTVYVYCTMPFPAVSPFMFMPWSMPGYIPTGIFITLCWFSVLFEAFELCEFYLCDFSKGSSKILLMRFSKLNILLMRNLSSKNCYRQQQNSKFWVVL